MSILRSFVLLIILERLFCVKSWEVADLRLKPYLVSHSDLKGSYPNILPARLRGLITWSDPWWVYLLPRVKRVESASL